jgi:hypothetical protein
MVKSCDEFRYMMFSKTVQVAQYDATQYERDGDRWTRVTYEFTDGSRKRKETDDLKPEDPKTGPLTIQYIPRSEDSRILGHTEWGWCVVPGAMLVAMGVFGWKFWKFYKS